MVTVVDVAHRRDAYRTMASPAKPATHSHGAGARVEDGGEQEFSVWRTREKLDVAVVPGCGAVGWESAVAGMVEDGNIQNVRRGPWA